MDRAPSTDARFRRIYDAHYERIRNYCLRRLPVHDVGDAMSEVFLVTWRKLDSVPEGDEAKLWLYKVAQNVVANRKRSVVRRLRLADKATRQPAPQPEEPEPIVVRREEDTRMLEALERLTPEQRELLKLRAWEQLPSAEIAAMLDISPDAVDMRIARARKKLAQLMAVSDADPLLAEGGERS